MDKRLFRKELLEEIGKHILRNKETVATAESVTSGLLQAAMSIVPDASKFFQGGLTAYNVAQKYRHLSVEPIHALSVNCVSERVAADMSLNVCKQFNSNWGLAVTGYATPVPESDHKLFAYYAISHNGTVLQSGSIEPEVMEPFEVQLFYANEVLRRWHSVI